jgi:hypothetical protein
LVHVGVVPSSSCWNPLDQWYVQIFVGYISQHINLYVYILYIFTLWLFNIAMENGPFIDGLPIKNGDFPWLC